MKTQRKARRRSKRLLLRVYRPINDDVQIEDVPKDLRQEYVRAIVRDAIWRRRS